jgi:hypothetical protein
MTDLIAELEGVNRLREASKDAGGKFSIEGTPEFVDYTRKLLALYRDHHAEIAAAVRDSQRIDWLADPENKIGNVQLPSECVMANLHSLRAAIDTARLAGEGEG